MRALAPWFVVFVGSVGCSEENTPLSDASQHDSGAADVGSVDAPVIGDARSSDDVGRDATALDDVGPPDAGPPDPRTCTLGVEDDCCPLALRYGGDDPDCASLDCETATVSEPIVLDLESARAAGTAALSWTGRDLRIAWADLESRDVPAIWSERRGPDGTLLDGPTREVVDLGSPSGFLVAGAALGYAPSNDSGVFVSLGATWHAVATDGSGWVSDLPASCNGFHQPISVYDTGTEWLVGQVQETCASPMPAVRLTRVSRDGTVGDAIVRLGRSRLGLSTAYNGANEVALFYGGSSPAGNVDLRARVVDVSAFVEGDETLLISAGPTDSIDQVEAGHDGATYGFVYGTYSPLGAARWLTRFRTWSPGGDPSAPTALITSGDRRFAQGRVAGTADGWTVVMTTVESAGTSIAPGAGDSPEVWVFRLAPDGRVRQSIEIDADQLAARLPDVAWVGDRMALTWARRDAEGRESHMLSFLGCD